MISCNLKGGLGNIMFQIATIEYLGNKHNFEVGYDLKSHFNFLDNEKNHNPSLNHSNEYLNIFKNVKNNKKVELKNTTNLPFSYVDFNVYDNLIYDGFFQSEKYFPDRGFVLNLFEPSDFVLKRIEKYKGVLEGNTCSIHIRRGDYLKSTIHNVMDMDYFTEGMSIVGADKYLVFSDDINWCKENLIGEKFIFIDNEKDYVELFLQSMCKNNIISNSSFSWWGAYLNKYEDKKVIAPNKWFKDNNDPWFLQNIDTEEDIIPNKWIKI